ncbi:MAG: sugar phosphate isomerase/epimerase family protein [Gammaproteobacteria bacterium]
MLPDCTLVASHYTVARVNRHGEARADFPRRCAAAAAAGYRGLGLSWPDFKLQRERHGDAGLRAILTAHDLVIDELDCLGSGWADEGEALAQSRAALDDFMSIADALGGRYLVVGDLRPPGQAPVRERMIEGLAAVADRAAAHGLKIAVEFYPWSAIADVTVAWDLVRATGRANAGLLLDFWHHLCGSADDAALRALPPERIVGVQITDGDPDPAIDDPLRRTQLCRRFPGEGRLPIDTVFRSLSTLGVDIPLAVESVDLTHRDLDVEATAAASYRATRTAIARALNP